MNEDLPHLPAADVQWTAFCYVSGEMSQAEAEQFEQLLARDQDAREAVARAYELTRAVKLAVQPAVRVSPRRLAQRSWRSTAGWALVGVGLASILLAMLFSVPEDGLQTTDRIPPEAPSMTFSDELAEYWVVAGQQYAATSLTGLEVEDFTELLDELPLAEPAGGHGEPEPTLSAPSWMLAAVAHFGDDAGEVEN